MSWLGAELSELVELVVLALGDIEDSVDAEAELYVLRAGAMPGTAPNQPENRERGKATDWIVALFIVTLT